MYDYPIKTKDFTSNCAI